MVEAWGERPDHAEVGVIEGEDAVGSVPVGKDSLSMRTRWTDAVSGEARQVTSPVSLVVTAFASLPDVRGTWTPQLRERSALVLVDLGARTLARPIELPLSVITAAVGAPFFLWLMRRSDRVPGQE